MQNEMVDMGNDVFIPKNIMNALDKWAEDHYAYHDDKARQHITDPDQQEYFEQWLKGTVLSPLANEMPQVHDAIIYLCGVGCG